jgi:hypothetical protein
MVDLLLVDLNDPLSEDGDNEEGHMRSESLRFARIILKTLVFVVVAVVVVVAVWMGTMIASTLKAQTTYYIAIETTSIQLIPRAHSTDSSWWSLVYETLTEATLVTHKAETGTRCLVKAANQTRLAQRVKEALERYNCMAVFDAPTEAPSIVDKHAGATEDYIGLCRRTPACVGWLARAAAVGWYSPPSIRNVHPYHTVVPG